MNHLGVEARFRPSSEGSLAQQGAVPSARQYILICGRHQRPQEHRPPFAARLSGTQAAHPCVSFVVTGKRQWQTRAIDETFTRLALEPHVHFTGYVPDADLPALYGGATAFVFPSLYEGFGLPPLEAMACGTPVVTSNVSSLPEVVGDAALTVDPTDVKAIAEAINGILDNPALAADLRARGLARAKQFTWERTAQQTLAVYDEVLARRRKEGKR